MNLAAVDLPVGTVIPYVGSSTNAQKLAAKGWKLCNGEKLSRTDYTELFDAIGTAFGGDGAPHFYLPDLRGMFLRGVSEDSGRDPDADKRTAQHENGNTGNKVGTQQGDAFKEHLHTWKGNFGNIGHDGNNLTVQTVDPNQGNLGVKDTCDKAGGSETRPVNLSVYYLIKVRAAQADD